jgi:hypothetical protein
VQGPCGEEWDDDYDGDMTSKPLWGFPNADGISVACADTIIERNVRYHFHHLLPSLTFPYLALMFCNHDRE